MLTKAKKVILLPHGFIRPNVLWPVASYKHRLKNRQEIEDNINRRKLTGQINLTELYDNWKLYINRKSEKEHIEQRRNQIRKNLSKFKDKKSLIADEQCVVDSSIQELRSLYEDLENARQSFDVIHEQFNANFVALPNKVWPNTPDKEEIVHAFGAKPDDGHRKHHLDQNSDLITFINKNCYFLQNAAATFDYTFPLKCTDYFRRHNFGQSSNCDFIRTMILESVAEPLEHSLEVEHSFDEKCKNLVYLTGGGSWLSYMGCVTLSKIEKCHLPLQFVSYGRIYQPTNRSNDLGLFDVTQSSGVQILLADFNVCINERFESTLKLIIDMYKLIDMHFRVVHVPAHRLRKSECFSARIEMYSPSQQRYIEIGNLSHFGDFLSHRLRFECEGAEKATQHKPHIILGTICNVTKLLGIILETHNGIIPQKYLNNNALVQTMRP